MVTVSDRGDKRPFKGHYYLRIVRILNGLHLRGAMPRAHPALESGDCKTIPYLPFLQRPTIFMVRIQSHAFSSIFFLLQFLKMML